MQKYLVFIIILVTVLSCNSAGTNRGEPVARVYSNYLYRQDLEGIFPANITPADSARIASNYIDKWVRNQLFLRLAEINLPEEEKNLDKQIANYRTTLLVHKYQHYLLGQKLDSLVTMREIEEYYNNHVNNLLLERPAIRGVFLKVPADAPNREQLTGMFTGALDMTHIESYANRYAKRFLTFTDTWMYADDLLREFPAGSTARSNFPQSAGQVTASDHNFFYFMGITEYMPPGERMPLSVAARKIKNIIINRRKIQFLNELEKSVMNEGLDKNSVQYF